MEDKGKSISVFLAAKFKLKHTFAISVIFANFLFFDKYIYLKVLVFLTFEMVYWNKVTANALSPSNQVLEEMSGQENV